MHEEPQVPNYGRPGTGLRIEPGMCFAIEPMFNLGGDDVVLLDDGWTVVTRDGSASAHFENTIAVSDAGPGGPHRPCLRPLCGSDRLVYTPLSVGRRVRRPFRVFPNFQHELLIGLNEGA